MQLITLPSLINLGITHATLVLGEVGWLDFVIEFAIRKGGLVTYAKPHPCCQVGLMISHQGLVCPPKKWKNNKQTTMIHLSFIYHLFTHKKQTPYTFRFDINVTCK